jgi:hypothetical protein
MGQSDYSIRPIAEDAHRHYHSFMIAGYSPSTYCLTLSFPLIVPPLNKLQSEKLKNLFRLNTCRELHLNFADSSHIESQALLSFEALVLSARVNRLKVTVTAQPEVRKCLVNNSTLDATQAHVPEEPCLHPTLDNELA